MSRERIDELNDCNSLIVFCVNETIYLISEYRWHVLVISNNGPRQKRLTIKILKSILSRWEKYSYTLTTPLIFNKQDNIENKLLEIVEPLTRYRSPKIKWYYTVSL